MVKYRKIMGKVRHASWVNVHVNVRWDRNGKRKIRYDKRKGKEKKKENRTQQRVRNNTPSLRGETPARLKCFGCVGSGNVVFE